MKHEEHEELLAIWEQLCLIFSGMSIFNTRHEDVVLSMETWKNDHVSLNFRRSPAWKETNQLVRALPTESISSLLELSKVNLTHINSHLTFTLSACFSVPLALYGLLGNSVKSLLAQLGVSVTVASGFLFIMLMTFVTKLWQNKWQGMELSTCLQTILAIRRASESEKSPINKMEQTP